MSYFTCTLNFYNNYIILTKTEILCLLCIAISITQLLFFIGFPFIKDVEVDTDSYTLMVVDISLTEEGLQSVSEVVGAVMQYVSVISHTNTKELVNKWNDFVSIQSINFEYAPKDDPDSFVS